MPTWSYQTKKIDSLRSEVVRGLPTKASPEGYRDAAHGGPSGGTAPGSTPAPQPQAQQETFKMGAVAPSKTKPQEVTIKTPIPPTRGSFAIQENIITTSPSPAAGFVYIPGFNTKIVRDSEKGTYTEYATKEDAFEMKRLRQIGEGKITPKYPIPQTKEGYIFTVSSEITEKEKPQPPAPALLLTSKGLQGTQTIDTGLNARVLGATYSSSFAGGLKQVGTGVKQGVGMSKLLVAPFKAADTVVKPATAPLFGKAADIFKTTKVRTDISPTMQTIGGGVKMFGEQQLTRYKEAPVSSGTIDYATWGIGKAIGSTSFAAKYSKAPLATGFRSLVKAYPSSTKFVGTGLKATLGGAYAYSLGKGGLKAYGEGGKPAVVAFGLGEAKTLGLLGLGAQKGFTESKNTFEQAWRDKILKGSVYEGRTDIGAVVKIGTKGQPFVKQTLVLRYAQGEKVLSVYDIKTKGILETPYGKRTFSITGTSEVVGKAGSKSGVARSLLTLTQRGRAPVRVNIPFEEVRFGKALVPGKVVRVPTKMPSFTEFMQGKTRPLVIKGRAAPKARTTELMPLNQLTTKGYATALKYAPSPTTYRLGKKNVLSFYAKEYLQYAKLKISMPKSSRVFESSREIKGLTSKGWGYYKTERTLPKAQTFLGELGKPIGKKFFVSMGKRAPITKKTMDITSAFRTGGVSQRIKVPSMLVNGKRVYPDIYGKAKIPKGYSVQRWEGYNVAEVINPQAGRVGIAKGPVLVLEGKQLKMPSGLGIKPLTPRVTKKDILNEPWRLKQAPGLTMQQQIQVKQKELLFSSMAKKTKQPRLGFPAISTTTLTTTGGTLTRPATMQAKKSIVGLFAPSTTTKLNIRFGEQPNFKFGIGTGTKQQEIETQRFKGMQRTQPMFRPTTTTGEKQVGGTILRPAISFGSGEKQLQRQAYQQITRQPQPTKQVLRGGSSVGVPGHYRVTTPPPPIIGGDLSWGSFQRKMPAFKMPSMKAFSGTKYKPSLFGIAYKIKTPRAPRGTLTGLEIRPMVMGKSLFRKARRRKR